MKGIGGAALLVVALLAIGGPAGAQEPVEVDASIGLQGYVVPHQPATVSVRVQADVLFVGDLQVTSGGVSLFTPIEVPAGSTKGYSIDMPPLGANSRVLVRLFVSGGDQPIAQKSLTVLDSSAKPLIGLFSASGVESDLAAATTVPFGRALTVLTVTPDELAGELGPLSYLVVGPGALTGADREAIDAVTAWVDGGGRLIGEIGDIAAIGGGNAVPFNEATTLSGYGAGELITVSDLSAVATWRTAIRDVPPLSLASTDSMNDSDFQMFQAATSSNNSVTPGIPWLLAALTIYVLVVGPVNFFVLRRIKRKELAWVTIPAISLVMLAILWVAGRSQVDSRIVAHSSLIVQGGDVDRADSAIVVVAGEGGEHSLDVPSGWSLAPFDASMMFGIANGIEASVGPAPAGGTRLTFDMPDLGAATLKAAWRPEPIAVTASVVADGSNLELTVTNNSQLEFWAWGISYAGAARAAPDALQPGQTGTTTLRSTTSLLDGGSAIGDAVMSRGNRNWDDQEWNAVWPLAQTAAWEEAATMRSHPVFFGFTEDLTTKVIVDGATEEAHGPSLVIIPLELPDGGAAAVDTTADIIRIVGANSVDSYPGWLYAMGADALELRFEVASGAAGEARIVYQGGGQLPNLSGFEVYNWRSGVFDPYQWSGAFPLDGHVSVSGELMARLSFDQNGFNDELDLPDNSMTLSVEAS